ncbi:MAG TPA: sulfurtransferase TusA family protein [Lapillicoccus sp.]|nr:sulfurtransferase TusA family protein [Lapillicoccus sp.]
MSPTSEVVEVDARGLRCPVPVIRLGAVIRDLEPGSLVRLLATDPAARSDVAAFCRMRGHELVEAVDDGESDVTAYLVRRA